MKIFIRVGELEISENFVIKFIPTSKNMKTFDSNNINEDTILKIQNKTGDYRITSIFEGFKDKFVKISATKRG